MKKVQGTVSVFELKTGKRVVISEALADFNVLEINDLTREEKKEVAEYMIKTWKTWAGINGGAVGFL